MRTLLKILGSLLALALFALGSIIALGLYLNERAEHSARGFCGAIAAGTAVTDITTRATNDGIRMRQLSNDSNGETIAFVFPGWIFNAWSCQMDAEDGRVTASRIIEEDD
jgi:hypothetical protein